MFEMHLLFLVLSLHRALVRADYTIDDSDYSVLKFSENPAGPVWGPFGTDSGEVLQLRLPNETMQTIDATQCYDGTYTYAACNTSDNCAVQFSFTGSGITIYVLQAGLHGTSASLSIDSGAATTATLDAPPAPQYYVPRVILFDVQNIPSGTHTAEMTVLDWDGSTSGMMLDYVDVNQSVVTSPTTSSSSSSSSSPSPSSTPNTTPTQSSSTFSTTSLASTIYVQTTQTIDSETSSAAALQSASSFQSSTMLPSSTPSTNATSSSSTLKGSRDDVVVGGISGGVICLLGLLGLALFYFRRRSRLQKVDGGPRPPLSPHDVRFINTDATSVNPLGISAALTTSRPSGASRPLPSWTDLEAGSIPNNEDWNSRRTILVPISYAHVAPGSDDGIGSPVSASTSVAIVSGPTVGPASHPNEKSQPSSSWGTSTQRPEQIQNGSRDMPVGRRNTAALTDEQADFVNSLFNNNVPAPVVARVLERMIANPHHASDSDIGVGDAELCARLDRGDSLFTLSQRQRHRRQGSAGVSWLPTLSDIGDLEETAVDVAPPSYDDARDP